MTPQELQLPSHHQVIVDRFVTACQSDERIVAACVVGSYPRGTTDAFSDLDLFVITADDAYDDFRAGGEAFVRQLGEPIFLEDFGSAAYLLFILADGTEVDLGIWRQSQAQSLFTEPYWVLLDKRHLLTGQVPPAPEAIRFAGGEAAQIEMLRRQIYWFWHDMSHLIKALGRGQLWWASGQLEALRLYCVSLARLRQDITDTIAGSEGYFKVDQALPTEQLAPLLPTFCPQEPGAMLQAAWVIVRFYQSLAPSLAQAYGLVYPVGLERVMLERLKALT